MLNIIFIPRLGILGAAITTLLSYLVVEFGENFAQGVLNDIKLAHSDYLIPTIKQVSKIINPQKIKV